MNQLACVVATGKYQHELPKEIKTNEVIFSALNGVEQVNVAWDNLEKYWMLMGRDAKILSVYRAVSENTNNELLYSYLKNETDLLVKCVLYLSGKKDAIIKSN